MAGATTEALLRYARAVSDDARYDALRELAAAGAGPNALWRLLGTAPLPGNAVQALPPIDYDADLRRDEALIHRLHPEAGVEWWYWAYVAADGGAFTIACFALRRSGAGRTWYEFASTTEAGPLLAFEGAGEPAPADGSLRFPEHGVEFSLRPGLLVIGERRFAAPARPGATVFPGGRGVLGDYQYASFPLDDGASFAWADHQWGTPGKNCSALIDVGYALRWGDLANLQPVDLSFGIVGCELWMGLALRPGGAAEEEFWNVSWGGLRVPRAGEALRTKAFTSRGATVELELVPEGIGAEGAPARWRARARPGAADEWAFVVEVPVLRRFPWPSGGYIYESPARVLDAAGAPAGAGVVENVGWGASIAESAARVVPEASAALRPTLLARSRAPGTAIVALLGAALRVFEAASGAGAGGGGGGGGGGGAGEGFGGLGYDPVVRPGVVLERRPPLARTYFAHNRAMRAYVGTLRVRDKRKLFSSLRAPDIDTDVYIPPYGFVAGVFATNYLLGDGQRKKNGSSTFSLRREGEAP